MTINAEVFRRARREGLPLHLAAYVARPPALDLDWTSHYQVDGEWADVTHDGRTYRVTVRNVFEIEGTCTSCEELVDAYRRKDDGIAWLTPDDFDRMEHRTISTVMLDDDDEEIPGTEASLWGVCGFRSTEMERLQDDRYLAETALDLITESEHYAAKIEADAERHDAEVTTAARAVVGDGRPDALAALLTAWQAGAGESGQRARVAATFFALIGARGLTLDQLNDRVTSDQLMATARKMTPGDPDFGVVRVIDERTITARPHAD